MGPSNSGSNDSSGSMSKFRNEVRMQKLLHAFRRGDRVAMEEHISSRAENSKLHRKLRGKDAVWEGLKEGVVYKVVTEGEAVVAKFFDDYPFHEICGNVVGTSLLGQGGGGPFYVRTLDIGKSVDNKQFIIVMEFIEADAEAIDLDEPINLYNLLYQVAFGVEQLRRTAGLQHFDLRYDNIMVKVLPEPKDLFKNGILSSFVIKIGDFGQCEFDFPPHPTSSSASSSSSSAAKAIAVPPPTPPPPAAAAVAAVGSKRKQRWGEEEDREGQEKREGNGGRKKEEEGEGEGEEEEREEETRRPRNVDIPREDEYTRKWGSYPRTYSGYDIQYFLGTLTPVLTSLHGLAFYYIYGLTLAFLQPCAFTSAQDRPTQITTRMPVDVLRFLKDEVAPTL